MITAEEFLKGKPFSIEAINQHMIKFTKLHCIEQARVISEKAKIETFMTFIKNVESATYLNDVFVDKDSILNAYDLNIIK
jgi:hypothetical protein